jgi:arginine utilization regulatory protein
MSPRLIQRLRTSQKTSISKKNLFEAYPSLDRATSSVVECITTGEVVIRKFQKIVDFTGKVTWSNNITVPLIRKGMIMGAVELAKDVATVDTLESENNEDDRLFNELAESIKKTWELSPSTKY